MGVWVAITPDDGMLTGSCTGTFTELVRPGGTGNVNGSETCSGSVEAQAGTYILRFVGTTAADGSFGGTCVLSGTGGLANLHGQGTFTGAPPRPRPILAPSPLWCSSPVIEGYPAK